jgi:protein-S-isoprenylcysteine O-methyltransferase Ste14
MASPTPGPDGGTAAPQPGGRPTLVRWLKSTSNRSFVLYPVCVVAFELAIRSGNLAFVPWGAPLLIWGYLQYLLVGRYRARIGGGGPGLGVPPLKIVDQGPYKYLRNPMYLAHLIFMAGLAVTFRSLPAVALLAFHMVWFHCRVLEDERHLEEIFGAEYAGYKARVKRWIPGLL